MRDLLKEIQKETKKIWINKPEDINLMLVRKGPRGYNFTVCDYAAGATNAIVYFFHCIRITLKKEETVDLKTLIALTCNLLNIEASRYRRYYNMRTSPELIEKVVDILRNKVKSVDEFSEILDTLTIYIGKLNYWLDLEVPWHELSVEYLKVKG